MKKLKKIGCLTLALFLFVAIFSGCENDFVNAKYFSKNSESVDASIDGFKKDGSYIEQSKDTLKVFFLDVGQADASLIICNGKVMLVDGGEIDDGAFVVSVLNSLKIKTIDVLINTHAHADHLGGLVDVVQNFEIKKVIISPCGYTSDISKKFFNELSKKHIKTDKAVSGENLDFGGAKIQIVGPISQYEDDLNNTSVVFRMVFNGVSFLFAGDSTAKEEKEILSAGYVLNSDILKVGHHGSDGSSSYVFLREVTPKYSVISVAKDNSYGHPGPDAISRLRDVGSAVYRTDQMGTIVATVTKKGKLNFDTINKSSDDAIENRNKNLTSTTVSVSKKITYVGDKRQKKFHKSTCSYVPNNNQKILFSTRDDAMKNGYSPCNYCNP